MRAVRRRAWTPFGERERTEQDELAGPKVEVELDRRSGAPGRSLSGAGADMLAKRGESAGDRVVDGKSHQGRHQRWETGGEIVNSKAGIVGCVLQSPQTRRRMAIWCSTYRLRMFVSVVAEGVIKSHGARFGRMTLRGARLCRQSRAA